MAFSFYHPITIRYADLDPQGHVNNATVLTYLESARLAYYETVGIWHRHTGETTGMVVAHIDIDYLAPIFLDQQIHVGLSVARMGEKSLTFEFQIETIPEAANGSLTNVFPLARGKSVMVAYDNRKAQSIPIPAEWREKITHFEKREP